MLGLRVAARMTPSIDGAGQRWYAHSYNRPNLYRLAATLSWVPRRLRLALARHIGRLAPSRMPTERAAIRTAMARFTGATGSRLDTLTVRVFTDFAMCFSDLVSTNRQIAALRSSHVGNVEGVERLASLPGGLDLADGPRGQLGAGRTAPRRKELPGRRTWWSLRTKRRSCSAGCGEMARACVSSRDRVPPCRWNCSPRSDAARWWACKGTGRSAPGVTSRFPSSATRRDSRSGPFRLSSAVKVPLLPAFCLLDSQYRYVVKIAEPFIAARGEEEAAARTWVAALEAIVREYPTQWFNFFDIWAPFGE